MKLLKIKSLNKFKDIQILKNSKSMSKYQTIVKHYENCLEEHGDSHLGVDWTKEDQVWLRHQTMLELLGDIDCLTEPVSLLDFGCGLCHFYEYLKDRRLLKNINYSGLEISEKFAAVSKAKHPDVNINVLDIMKDSDFDKMESYDYIVMNGPFTEKLDLTQEEMETYVNTVLARSFKKCNKGLAVNFMSPNVDWEDPKLFYYSLDRLTKFLCKELSRNIVIRHDYGLYEYTVYIYV